MPSVHYGRLPDIDLLDLWQSETAVNYRKQFGQRVNKHDEAVVSGMLNTSGSNRLKAIEAAKEAMPEPPPGCNVCHYLYDI